MEQRIFGIDLTAPKSSRQRRKRSAFGSMDVHWQHWINFLAGGWLFISPWALDYLYQPVIAAANALLLGAAILLCSLLALQFEETESAPKAAAILGAWTMLAPWALKFTDPAMIAANTSTMGFLVLVMSLWMVAEDRSGISWRRNGPGRA